MIIPFAFGYRNLASHAVVMAKAIALVTILLTNHVFAESDMDLADAATFYVTVDQMQMAYYENDSDRLLLPLQKHNAYVQNAAQNDRDVARLVHYWIGASRFHAILSARQDFAGSIRNAKDWIEKASTQQIKASLGARVLLEEAEMSLSLGLPAKALAELDQISSDILKEDHPLNARVHSARAGVYLALLDGVAALRQARLAMDVFAKLGDIKSATQLRAEIRLAGAQNMVGVPNAEESLTAFSEKITSYNQPKTLLLAEFFATVGVAIYGEAQAAQSANIFESLVAKASFDSDHPLVLNAKMGLMIADAAIGKNNSAVQRGIAIISSMSDETPEDSILLADLFVQLARFSANSDGAEQALVLAGEGLAMSARVAGSGSPYHLVKTLDVAGIFSTIQEHAKALELLQSVEVASIAQGAGLDRSSVSITIAGIYEQAGEKSEALKFYKEALESIAANPVANLANFMATNAYAAAMDRMNKTEHALPASRAAAALLQDIVSQEKDNRDTTHFDPEASQRIRALRAGNKPVFARLLAQLQALPESVHDRAIQNEAFAAAQWANGSKVEDILGKVSARMSASAPRLKELLRQKQDISNELNAAAQKHKLASMGVDYSGQNALESKAYKGVMNALVGKIASINKQIDADYPDFTAAANIEILSIEDIQRQLSLDTALLYYYQTEDDVFLWAINKRDTRFLKLTLTATELEQSVKRIRTSLDASNSVRSFKSAADNNTAKVAAFDRKSAHELYNALIRPVKLMLDRADTLLIAANGSLSSLPLSLLVVSPPHGQDNDPQSLRDTDWLVKYHAAITLPSIRYVHKGLGGANRSEGKNQQVELLAFGNPLLGGSVGISRSLDDVEGLFSNGLANVEAVRSLAPLPNTDRELKRIAKTLGTSEQSLYLGQQATESALKKADMAGVNVLAFATHGLLSGELSGLAEPALVFTPPKSASVEDDGLLTASELALLRLDVDWIIFSACNTAAGDGSVNAEGLSGLASAALYAGAKALLVSHWPVLDDAAADLTTKTLARNYGTLRESRAQALRHAMLELMGDSSRPHYAHPAAWAPFVVVGGIEG